jgi:outer membrane protein assembly factor BamB
VAPPVASVDTASPRWTSPQLDGQLYGEPLVSGGLVYVATEADTVYALSSSSGAVVWSTHLGTPVSSGLLPCGNISPTVGVTGTPVIDEARDEIFVVADEQSGSSATHHLVGLNAASGQVELDQDVDPPGADPLALLQRTGLNLDAGRVAFGFGGNYGDCSTYHGWLIAVPETGGSMSSFEVDSGTGDSQGAIWMGGAAPAVDSAGNLWVSVGNGSVTSSTRPYDDSDSVLELSPALQLLQFFAPSQWASDNAHDLDMSTEPALLSGGLVVAAGKARIVYLLSAANLGSVGGQLASLPSACDDDIDGGVAIENETVFLPCLSGIIAVTATSSPPALHLAWSSGEGGGPPILAGGLVWTIGSNGTLFGLDPHTGSARIEANIGAPANHFPTPSVGAGLLLAPSANRVVAFAAAAPATSGPTTTVPKPHTTEPKAAQTSSDLPAGALAAIAVAAALIAAVFGRLWWLRRRRHS